VLGDRGYDSNKHRHAVRERGITPLFANRYHGHGSGLGRYRWVVERTFSWLHQMKRLLVRYERRADIHDAFLALGCCLICYRRLNHAL
jgi:transposase